MSTRNKVFLAGMTYGALFALSVPARAQFVVGTLATTSGFTETATSLLFCLAFAIPCPNTTYGTFNIGDTGTGSFAACNANDPGGVNGYWIGLTRISAGLGTVLPGNGFVF